MTCSPSAAILLLAASAATQQLPTFPTGMHATPGGTQQVLAWAPERIQTIYHPSVLPSGTWTLSALQLRPRNPLATAMTAVVTIRVASAGVPLPGAASDTSFAANHGTDLATTTLANVAFPAQPSVLTSPVTLPLAAPFVHTPGAPLLIEIDVTATSAGFVDWVIDLHAFASEYWSPTEQVLGSGCADGTLLTKVATSFPPEEHAVWKFFSPHPAATPAVLLLGLSDQVFAGSLPLPVDLGYLGAPGCQLQVSIDTTRLVLGTTTGFSPQYPTMFSSSVFLPRDPVFAGTQLSGQFAILDPGHNAAGFVTTPHARFDLMTPPAHERMRYSQSYLVPSVSADVIQNWIPDQGVVFNAVVN